MVSVIVPTFNRRDFVLEAIDSVWRQTYRPIELIVVDDGSTDGTWQAVEDWRKHRSLSDRFELRYFRQENRGAAAARNRGLIESRGEYIQFLDSDDLLLPERFSEYVKAFEADKDVELVHGAFYLDYCATSDKKVKKAGPASFGERPTPMDYIWTAAGLFRRRVIYEAGPWNEGLNATDDVEYFARVLGVTERAWALAKPTALKRKHGGHRLVDYRFTEGGFTDEMRCLTLCGRVLRHRGYEEEHLAARWLGLAEAALVAGFKQRARDILNQCGSLCRLRLRWRLRWAILCLMTGLPEAPVAVYYQVMRRFHPKLTKAKKRQAI